MRGAVLLAALLAGRVRRRGEHARSAGRGRRASCPPSLPPIPYAVEFAGDLPPELAAPAAPGRRQRRSRRSTGRPAASPSASAPRPTGRSWSRRCARRAISTARWPSRSSTSIEAPAETAVTEVERLATRPEAVLRFDVAPGPRYRFGALAVELADNPDGFAAPTLEGSRPRRRRARPDPGRARRRAEAPRRRAQGRLRAGHARRARSRSSTTRRSEMDVTLRLDPGRRAEFGEVSFTGGDGIDADFLRGRGADRGRPALRPDPGHRGPDQPVRHQPVLDHRPAPGRAADRATSGSTSSTTSPAPAALDRRRAQLRDRHRPRAHGCSGSTATSSAPASGSAPRSPAAEPQQSLTDRACASPTSCARTRAC